MIISTPSGGMLITGRVFDRPDYKRVGTNGTPKAMFKIACGYDGDRRNVYKHCVAWRDLADYAVRVIQTGCYVEVTGEEHEREYNGKTYIETTVDWINAIDIRKPSTGKSTPRAPARPPYREPIAPNPSENLPNAATFTPVSDDDLPF